MACQVDEQEAADKTSKTRPHRAISHTPEYTTGMEVTVLLFGPAAMALGKDRATVSTQAATTAAELLRLLEANHAALIPFVASGVGRLAVNRTFAPPGQTIGPDDEVALIAMVSGG